VAESGIDHCGRLGRGLGRGEGRKQIRQRHRISRDQRNHALSQRPLGDRHAQNPLPMDRSPVSLTQKKFPHQPTCFRGKAEAWAINRLFFRKMLDLQGHSAGSLARRLKQRLRDFLRTRSFSCAFVPVIRHDVD
jgi:hypothetical protein